MEKLVSVIVPIHNTSKYLKRCLNSITKQTYSNLEIILINDGSTDKSGEICNKYAKKDSRIKVLHNETAGGVANARNKGLSIATGEYINFVDGDDWLTKNAIKVLVDSLQENNADIVQGDFQVVHAKKVKQNKKETILPNQPRLAKTCGKVWYIRPTLFNATPLPFLKASLLQGPGKRSVRE